MSRPETTDVRLTDLYELWADKRGDRLLPSRADFPPEVLKPWLGNVNLIEACDDGQYRYRLYGSAFVYRFGVEMTRRSIDELPPEQSAAIRRDYDAVVESRAPLRRLYTSGFDIMDINRRMGYQRQETWERLVLPLAAPDGERVALLMVAAYEQPRQESPDGAAGLSVES